MILNANLYEYNSNPQNWEYNIFLYNKLHSKLKIEIINLLDAKHYFCIQPCFIDIIVYKSLIMKMFEII
jgi:hypothetical protein